MEDKVEQYKQVLLATLASAEAIEYNGYSKFDGLHSPLTQALSFGWWPLRLAWTQLVMRAPFNLRPLLKIKKGVNPEAPALFAHANLDLAGLNTPGPFFERARKCLDWLLSHDSSHQGNYHGRCWGYHHPWQSPGFYQPPGYPNCYITTIVAGALLRGYQDLKTDAYLDAACSSSKFILQDLPVFYETDEEKCIAYVHGMRKQLQVININALAGALLAQIGAITGDKTLITQARKLISFVARQQTVYGAWFYTTDSRQSLVTHDNYHTGMILDSLLAYEQATGDERFQKNYLHGLEFYRDHLFLPNGAPKWTNSKALPHDVHGSAQGILTLSQAGDLDNAGKIADWGLSHFYKQNGNFAYQIQPFYKKSFTLAHWCNGWMVRGLGSLLVCLHNTQLKEVNNMPIGSEVALTPGLNTFERLYINIFGVPILGLRIRARTILPLLDDVGTPHRILDAGSGRGVMTMACSRRFPEAQVIGADLLENQNAINNAIARQLNLTNVQFETWDVLHLPKKETFDVIISSDTLEHLEDDLGGVKMFRSALNPGGYLIVHVPHLTRNLFGWHRQNWMDIEGHVRPGYTRSGLMELLEAGGLKVIKCVYNYNSLETLVNDISKLITGAKERHRGLYALVFPVLLAIANIGKLYRPQNDGSGLVCLAVRKD